MGLGDIIFYSKPQDVNLTNMMNKFSIAVLNNDLSTSHSSQQPWNPLHSRQGSEVTHQSPNSACSVPSWGAGATPVSQEKKKKLDTRRMRNLPKVIDVVNWKNTIPESNSKAQVLNYDADCNPS